eukprot:CAMPEP_0183527870 /NCGR_PEP_ID=MMETSP0371-20130417/22327_1 /TAXON_ID=268820 /ORGANISM="Peridinium aciculiferum, Strain PAER-2" /LENGTH=642 /DNA_ID=CAMNT_0025727407 /DNA_START=23 /DNA_END=1951 /DNA_ORIENTATION=+
MCGIFAYIGDRQAVALLVAALKRMEYRGYDSAGVGIHGTPIKICKNLGKVKGLETKCQGESASLEGTCGIAHTRWATHGKPSDENSHPHTTADNGVAVVHNGVIENYMTLKAQLTKKGYVFVSQTDTELLAHLIQDLKKEMPELTWTQIVAMGMSLCEGAYGVAFVFADDPDLIIGARKGSPLILGVGKNEYMLASDGAAIVEHTKDVVYLRDGEIVEMRRTGYNIQDLNKVAREVRGEFSPRIPGSPQAIRENPIVRLELSLEEIEKGGYEHFMLKEIMDQPNALRNALRGRLHCEDGKWSIKLGGLEKVEGQNGTLDRMINAKRIIIAACGTSAHSGLIAKYAFEGLAELPVEVEYASEFRYRRPIIYPEDVVIAISQSGETADTLEAIKIAQEHKALAFGIVNVVGSSIARLTDAGVYLHAGPEIGVASTKAFTGQVIMILLVALQVAFHRKTISQDQLNTYCEELEKVPTLMEEWLAPLAAQAMLIAKYFRLANNAIFCGCGIQLPVALEGALKLKEISYIHAEGFSAAEVKHGALTLIRNFIPCVVIAMKSDPAYEAIQATVEEFRSKDAALVILTDVGNTDFDEIANFVIHCPHTKTEFEPLLTAVPLQLLSYHIAKMRGCEIDQPRNLAKSVTVE